MTNQLIPLSFDQFPVRVIDRDGQLWFIASDIAEALGYLEAKDMTRNLDDDESDRHILPIRSDNGVEQDREFTIINESGLYSAIFRSRKPSAKQFKKWVTSEVLPSIRKTGSYQHYNPVEKDYLRGTIMMADVIGVKLQPKQKVLDAIETLTIHNHAVTELGEYLGGVQDFEFAPVKAAISMLRRPAIELLPKASIGQRIMAFAGSDKNRKSGVTLAVIKNRLRVDDKALKKELKALIENGLIVSAESPTVYNRSNVVKYFVI